MAEQQEQQQQEDGSALRAEWAVAKPAKRDYADVVTELNAFKLVGEGSIFERGTYVPVAHMGYKLRVPPS